MAGLQSFLPGSTLPLPTNPLVSPMLTDKYQLTMAYDYWKNRRDRVPAVFDLFFRKCPFGGEFAVFAGLDEVLKLTANFRFTDDHVRYMREDRTITKASLQGDFDWLLMKGIIRRIAGTNGKFETIYINHEGQRNWRTIEYPTEDIFLRAPMRDAEPTFFNWLQRLDSSDIRIYALDEGTLAFPRVPLLRVEGPIAVAQLMETPFLNLVGYPSLVATNAVRMRLAAGWDKLMSEFGIRRAQGPDGGLSGSRYSVMGSYDSTSNVLAGMLFGIDILGTHAHSLVEMYRSLDDLNKLLSYDSIDNIDNRYLVDTQDQKHDFVKLVLYYLDQLKKKYDWSDTNEGELAAFISYAITYPNSFLALVDTYDTLKSGTTNFLAVALALNQLGYKPLGVRLDSGDLAWLSIEVRKIFVRVSQDFGVKFENLNIAASNDINEQGLYDMDRQGNQINTVGIGTHQTTCQLQPAHGFVYKLVEAMDTPRIKLSNDPDKTTIPGRKQGYRLIGEVGYPLDDLMIQVGEEAPQPGQTVLARHPTDEMKRMKVTPTEVIPLHRLYWDGKLAAYLPLDRTIEQYVVAQIMSIRSDHIRPINPTPYKVSVSQQLYDQMHSLWQTEAPVTEIR